MVSFSKITLPRVNRVNTKFTLVGGRKLLDLLNQGSSNGLDYVMVTSRDIFQPSCGHFQSCNKGQGDTMDEMTILYIIQYLHYL